MLTFVLLGRVIPGGFKKKLNLYYLFILFFIYYLFYFIFLFFVWDFVVRVWLHITHK